MKTRPYRDGIGASGTTQPTGLTAAGGDRLMRIECIIIFVAGSFVTGCVTSNKPTLRFNGESVVVDAKPLGLGRGRMLLQTQQATYVHVAPRCHKGRSDGWIVLKQWDAKLAGQGYTVFEFTNDGTLKRTGNVFGTSEEHPFALLEATIDGNHVPSAMRNRWISCVVFCRADVNLDSRDPIHLWTRYYDDNTRARARVEAVAWEDDPPEWRRVGLGRLVRVDVVDVRFAECRGRRSPRFEFNGAER